MRASSPGEPAMACTNGRSLHVALVSVRSTVSASMCRSLSPPAWAESGLRAPLLPRGADGLGTGPLACLWASFPNASDCEACAMGGGALSSGRAQAAWLAGSPSAATKMRSLSAGPRSPDRPRCGGVWGGPQGGKAACVLRGMPATCCPAALHEPPPRCRRVRKTTFFLSSPWREPACHTFSMTFERIPGCLVVCQTGSRRRDRASRAGVWA